MRKNDRRDEDHHRINSGPFKAALIEVFRQSWSTLDVSWCAVSNALYFYPIK